MPLRRLRPLAALGALGLAAGLLSGCAGLLPDAFSPPRPVDSLEPVPPATIEPIAPSTGIATAPASADPPPPGDAFAMEVVSVHDGDTLRLRIATTNDVVTTTNPIKVRLIGIDTPEVYPDYECYGDEATAALEELAPVGSTVLVGVDADTWDDYDRRLFYLWTEDGTFVNLDLVRAGYAEAIRVAPNDAFWPELRAAEDEAFEAGLGLWAACVP